MSRIGIGGLIVAVVASCAAPPPPEPKPAPVEEEGTFEPAPLVVKPGEEVIEAGQAYSVGDPVRAVNILDLMPPDDPRREETAGLRAQAQADVDAIAADWLEKMDAFVAKNQFRMARARGLYILDHFPVGAETRRTIRAKLDSIKGGVAEARVEIRELRIRAADQLLRHDFVGGLRTLRRAETMARKFNFRDALDIERQMAAAEFRFAQERPAVADASDKGRRPSKPTRKRRGDKTNGKSAVDTGSEPVPAKEVQELLRAGSRHRKKKDYHRAIIAFDSVRRLDVDNNAARVAVESLQRKRQELIKSYLARANEHLLKQDLEGAWPMFKRVQELDPSNEEAMEGIAMYRNLERIRRQRQ